MAEEQKKLTVSIVADTAGFQQAVTAATASMQGFADNATKINEQYTTMVQGGKKTEKVTGAVGDAIEKAGKQAKTGNKSLDGFSRGIVSSTLHIGGLITPARLLGGVVGGTIVAAFTAGLQAVETYDAAMDKLSASTTDAAGALGVFKAANIGTYAAAESVAATQVSLLRLQDKAVNANAEYIASLATYWEENGVAALAGTDAMVDVAMVYGLTGDAFVKMTERFAGAVRENGGPVSHYLQGITADAAVMFKTYGYSAENMFATSGKLRRIGLDLKTLQIGMGKVLYEMSSSDPKLAAQKWAAFVGTMKSGNDAEALLVAQELGWKGETAARMILAAKRGALNLGQGIATENEYIPVASPDTLGEKIKIAEKRISLGLSGFFTPSDTPAKPNTPAAIEGSISSTGNLATVGGPGAPPKSVQQSAEWKTWWSLLTDQERQKYQNGTLKWPQTIDELKLYIQQLRRQGRKERTASVSPSSTLASIEQQAMGAGGTIGKASGIAGETSSLASIQGIPQGVQAAAGFTADYASIGQLVLASSEDTNNKLEIGSDRVTKTQTDNQELVLAYWQDSAYKGYRAYDATFKGIRAGSRETFGGLALLGQSAGEKVEKSFWSLDTVFGQFQIDITDAQQAFEKFGISGDQLFDNLITGWERIGYILAEDLGWDTVREDVKLIAGQITDVMKFLADNLGEYWKLITSDTAYSIEQINSAGLKSLQELAGYAVMALSEMFATGKVKLADLWKKIWTSLLDIAIKYVIKIITTESLMTQAMLMLEAVTAGITGNWAKVAQIALVSAGVLSTIAGITALVYGVGKAAEWVDTKVDEGQQERLALRNQENNPATTSSLDFMGPASYASSSSVNVSLAGANIYGTIDDRTARKLGEGIATGLGIRGVVPNAYA